MTLAITIEYVPLLFGQQFSIVHLVITFDGVGVGVIVGVVVILGVTVGVTVGVNDIVGVFVGVGVGVPEGHGSLVIHALQLLSFENMLPEGISVCDDQFSNVKDVIR